MTDLFLERMASSSASTHEDHWPRIQEIISIALEPFPEARTALAEALTKAIEPEPCPACGRK